MDLKGSRKRNPSEMSNPEIALNFEKEHLRSAEECDYMVMENLIQRRYEEEEEDALEMEDNPHTRNPTLLNVVAETRDYRFGSSWPPRSATLKRSEAIEGDASVGIIGEDYLIVYISQFNCVCDSVFSESFPINSSFSGCDLVHFQF